MNHRSQPPDNEVAHYIRAKVNQLLTLLGTLPLRPEELDDKTLIELDPIGIIADSFRQVLDNLQSTNHELTLARNEIRAIFDSMGAAIMVLDMEGRIEECNRQSLDWFFDGAEASAILGKPLSAICGCFGKCGEELHQPPQSNEFTCHDRYFLRISSDVMDEHDARSKRVLLFFDTTQQKAAETNLRLYATIFDNTAEGIAITDSDRRFIRVNDAFCTITGYRSEELLGRETSLLRSGHYDDAFYEEMRRQVMEGGYWQGELINRTKSGELVPLLQTINVIRDGNGNISHYFSIITDITAIKETQSRLDYLAHHDVLTDLPNRLLFNARLQYAIDRAQRDHEHFALLFIDLDRFKTINDSLGHELGDQVLVEVARRLRNMVRQVDTVARMGGDEFVILLEQLKTPHEAESVASIVVNTIKQPYSINGSELHIGCSIGIAIYPEDGTNTGVLMRNADTAMYQVKESGRDGFRRYTQELSNAAHEKLSLENSLRVALRETQLELYYQPIINLAQRRIVAAEALVRWNHPRRGLVTPDTFIPLAEESKLILPVGTWVAEEAIRQLARWQKSGINLNYLAINASSVQLFHPGFADELFYLLQQHPLGASYLQVELTENVLLRDINSCRQILQRMRDHGIRIAIDDFGTGYSSLAYLKQLPIDDLKIDRSFIRDLTEDSSDAAIVEAIIVMAHTLGLHTVAEGVEQREQENYLATIGCDKVQGYLYAKPLPAAAFSTFYHAFSK